jgi:hypothetical protein
MGQVLTNNTSVAVAVESSLAILPAQPVWKQVEPNSIGKMGAEITTTPRSPISKLRQRRKGTVTDLDSGAAYEEDMTLSSFMLFAEGFFFSIAVNQDLTFRAAPSLATGYTIPAANASQASRLQWVAAGMKSLVYARGYLTAANNGLKVLSADTGLAGVLIAVAGNAIETPPTNAEVSIAGIRAETGDLALAVSGTTGTLSSGNNAAVNPINFTTLGLTVGQFIHVGGLTNANQFGSTAAGNGTRSLGYARVRTIAAAALTLDKMSTLLVASNGKDTGLGGGTNVPVDLLFGRFVRNVSVDSAEFYKWPYQFELGYEDLFETDPPTPVANPDGFEYPKGNVANTLSENMPLTDKATLGFEFVGTDSEDPVSNASRKTNAATPILPLFTEPFNTSADFVRLRIMDVDETGLTTDLTDLTVSITNNVAPEKVLGRLGARFMNYGNLEVDIEATALFTNPLIPARIRANTTVSMDWILKNADGAIVHDIPSMTITGGAKDFPVNESVKIGLTCLAFVDPLLVNTSASVSLFPIVP